MGDEAEKTLFLTEEDALSRFGVLSDPGEPDGAIIISRATRELAIVLLRMLKPSSWRDLALGHLLDCRKCAIFASRQESGTGL